MWAGKTQELYTFLSLSTYIFIYNCCCCCLVTKLYPTLCDPMDWSLPGFSVHGISQARILEQVAISCPKGTFLTQGWSLRLLHLQPDSLPLSHQGIYKVQSHKKDFQCWQECWLDRFSRGPLDNMYPDHTGWLAPFISKHLSDKKECLL